MATKTKICVVYKLYTLIVAIPELHFWGLPLIYALLSVIDYLVLCSALFLSSLVFTLFLCCCILCCSP
ncbi:hypothetical protein Lalb_Chr15g0082831 [Lupinus albus]|uniref:Uncharacterized protein n=1 Tax=Lupinus albus TaxID=3870 RepID=A0A6A4P9D2_LUPAL|nr:hypothetical protein Lalb_Chr15g0082831 [Lupinus albus]